VGGRLLAAAGIAAFAAAPPATAAVSIGPDRIVVSGDGARASIDRRPLRIQFQDASGSTVLAQVENTGQAPLPTPPAPDPQPLGADNADGPALYAPLVFTVGDRTNVQYPLTSWVGNQLAGTEAGVKYSAREVVDARAEGASVRLTVSTSDPSGRTLAVTISPGAPGTLRVSVRPSSSDGVVTMGDSFASADGEAFRGFGGRHNALDQRGNDFYNWVEQQNTSAGPFQPGVDPLPGLGGQGYQFPNGPAAAYYVQSQFVSSRGYGFLLDRDELSAWRMASDRPDAWQVGAGGPALDYLVAPGSARDATSLLTGVTGRHRAPPDWALGPQLDRLTRFTGETAQTYEAAVRKDLEDIERYDLPLTAYRIEAWEFLSRDVLREVIARLRARGIHPLVYFRAFVGQDEIGTDRPAYYDEATSKGYVAKTATGQPYVYISNFNVPTAQIDFTNAEAIAWWERRVREALDLGADGFMQDFGEQVQADMHFANGETGETMHNRYPVLFHRATRRIVDRYESEHPGRELWFYTRSGYSGSPGSAAYEQSNFPGDESTDWSRSAGLASLATDMLNRGVGGAFGYGTDIGGYFDFQTPATTKELFLRWAEWAVFSPVFRLHGSINAGTHTPWTFDDETVRIYDRLSRLRLRAVPLVAELWRTAERTGMPVARPLWLAYPGDAAAARQDQEWMLGPDLLVAPVVTEGATSRRVYLPAGCWREATTGARYDGPAEREVPAPLDRLPYFTRCGSDPIAAAALRAGPCADRVAPVSRIERRRLGASRTLVDAGGRASDRGCLQDGKRRPGRVRRVDVSIARIVRGRCRFVDSTGRVQRAPRSCRRPILLPARGTARWRFRRRVGLDPGLYRLRVRAVDAAGNKERPARRGSASFRIR
jgi:alpha-glucosidase (family GH31 glycosyl hydrolase)